MKKIVIILIRFIFIPLIFISYGNADEVTVSQILPAHYTKIQEAITSEPSGTPSDPLIISVIDASETTYDTEIIDFSGKHDIILRSDKGRDFIKIAPLSGGPAIMGNASTANIKIDGFTLEAPYGLLFSSGGDNIKITNCDIINCDYGVYLNGVISVKISRSRIKYIGQNAVIGNSSQVVLNNSRIMFGKSGVRMQNNSDLELRNTTIEALEYASVALSWYSSGLIKKCKLQGAGTAIGCSGLSPCRIGDSKIIGMEWYGVFASKACVITNTLIKECYDQGIYSSGNMVSVKAINSVVTKCGATVGDAVAVNFHGELKMINCLIANNPSAGIGIFAAHPKIINCTIANNDEYGIISAGHPNFGTADLIIINSIIAYNADVGIYAYDGGIYSTADIRYCDAYGNGPTGNENYDGYSPGVGCISDPPLFKNFNNNDFHLQFDSLCKDAGAPIGYDPDIPEYDIEGIARPYGASVDMGAYEYSEALVLLYPEANAIINDPTPTFKWRIPIEPDLKDLHFRLEISTGGYSLNNFINNKIHTFESKYDTAGFIPKPPMMQGKGIQFYTMLEALTSGYYYWRISAWNGDDYYTSSEIRRFHLANTP